MLSDDEDEEKWNTGWRLPSGLGSRSCLSLLFYRVDSKIKKHICSFQAVHRIDQIFLVPLRGILWSKFFEMAFGKLCNYEGTKRNLLTGVLFFLMFTISIYLFGIIFLLNKVPDVYCKVYGIFSDTFFNQDILRNHFLHFGWYNFLFIELPY